MSCRTAVTILIGTFLFCAAASWSRTSIAQQPKPDDTRLKQLMRDRVGVRKEIVDLYTNLKNRGGASMVEVLLSTRELLWAELAAIDGKADRVKQLERIVEHEKAITAFFARTADISKAELLALRVRLLDAEETLERMKLQ